jgi:hypothetical protein
MYVIVNISSLPFSAFGRRGKLFAGNLWLTGSFTLTNILVQVKIVFSLWNFNFYAENGFYEIPGLISWSFGTELRS